MSKHANKPLIGAFVVGAVIILVTVLVILGSGRFFIQRNNYVLFFEGSVKGLNVGAPVIFHGVKIGQVTDIALKYDPKAVHFLVPVYIEIESQRISTGSGSLFEGGHSQILPQLIQKGYKAQLQQQSFVTGQLLINFDYYPNKPVKLAGLEKRYPEIPTVPTPLEELTKTLQTIKFDELLKDLARAVDGVERIVNSPELKQSMAALTRSLENLDKIGRKIDAKTDPLIDSVRAAADTARTAFGQVEKTLALKEGVPGDIAAEFRQTLASARVSLDETKQAVVKIEGITAQNANVGYEISRSLQEIERLSRTLNSLAEYLSRHPEALIKGKLSGKGE